MARARNLHLNVWLAPIALIAITFIAYIPAFHAGFIWDDPDYVINNPTLRSTEGLYNIWFYPHALPQYYPLVHTTFWIEYQLVRLNPALYHFDNILFHALSSILLWRVLMKLNVSGAFLAAAIFAIHPINVESVAWITERKNVLCALLYFASALAYLHFALDKPDDQPRWPFYACSLALFVLSLLSKTVTCSLPAALLLILLWKRRSTLKTLIPLVPMFATGALLALYTAHLESTHVGAKGAEWNFSLVDRFLIATRALWFYPAKLLLPIRQSFIYPKWPIDSHNPVAYLFALALALTLALLILLRRRITFAPLVAVLLYAGTALPALGVVNIYPMRYTFVADHYTYLALVPLIALAAALLTRWLPGPLPFIVLIPLFAATIVRATVFENPLTLWTDTANKNPNSWMVQLNLAHALAQNHQGDQAAIHFQRAVNLAPNLPETHGNLAMSLAARGMDDQALAQYDEALKIDPTFPEAFFGRGKIFQRQGRLDDAKRQFELAIKYFPSYSDAYYQLARIDMTQNDLDGAQDALMQAIRSDPTNAIFHNELAKVFLKKHDPNAALNEFAQAINLNPNFAEAHMNLGSLLSALGHPTEARQQVQEAIRLDPSLAQFAPQALHQH